MASARNIYNALGILLGELGKKQSHSMCASHDEVYLPGPPPSKLSAKQLGVLEALGATWDDGTESWRMFT